MATRSIANIKVESDELKARSLSQMAIRRFMRNRTAVFGAVLLIFILGYVILGSFVFTEAQANFNDTSRSLIVSEQFPLGTDSIGRDVLARSIYGGQISLMIGLFAVTVSLVFGVSIGLLSGYYGGWVDAILMRITEAMLSIPSILILLVLSESLGNRLPSFTVFGRELSGSLVVIIFIIGATSWMGLARIVRGSVLSLKNSEFVVAARSLGATDRRIVVSHIMPNTLAPIVVSATLGIAGAILSESYISFLGLGVKPPTATWGNMLDGARQYFDSAPWLWAVPSVLILITIMGINFVGDGLRDALDPRSQVD
jgi:peptide/nickel transport system permease protein